MQFELKPGITEDEAMEVCQTLHRASGQGGVKAIMPGGTWLSMALGMLESPFGQAVLAEMESLIQRGLIVAKQPAAT